MPKTKAAPSKQRKHRPRAPVVVPDLAGLSDDEYLTRDQLAALTKISPKTFCSREIAGKPIFPVQRIGGLPRYRVRDVKRVLFGGDDERSPAE